MESVNEIKEALSARSRTATLDELRSEGRKKVRLIRAEHVAAMVTEAVHAAIEKSGLIDPKEAERLVEKSRVEFRSILKEREQEAQHAQETQAKLAEAQRTIADLQQQLAKSAAGGQPAAAHALAGAPGNDLLMSLVSEMATMKANLMHEQAQARTAAPAGGGGGDFSAALEKLTGTLNDRLEKLGKKMGVSSAVEGSDTVDFGGMFKDTGKTLESNMENIEVKQKAGGGIAANLARLKKLKGGG